MEDKLMRLMSQFALLYVAVIVLAKAFPAKKKGTATVPTSPQQPALTYDRWTV